MNSGDKMLHRKIHISDEVWTYRVGSRFVKIKSPTGKAHYINKERLVWADTPVTNLDMYGEKNKVKPGLTPSAIKKYIEVVLVDGKKWFPHKHLIALDKPKLRKSWDIGPSSVVFGITKR